MLVASDAIGMGLNLNIRRVVFSSMYKFDGASGFTPSNWQANAQRAHTMYSMQCKCGSCSSQHLLVAQLSLSLALLGWVSCSPSKWG